MTNKPETIETIGLGVDELAHIIFDRLVADLDRVTNTGLCLLMAQDVLEMVASRVNTWQLIEPGTTIEKGTRFRFESLLSDGHAIEGTAVNTSRTATKKGRWFIERKPSEQVDPVVEKVAKAIHDADDESGGLSWDDEQHRTRDVYRRLARAALKAGSPT